MSKHQYNWFAFVLYPKYDEGHALILEYIKHNTILYDKWCGVEHTRDMVEDDYKGEDVDNMLTIGGEFKKEHFHIIVRTRQKMTADGFLKRWVVERDGRKIALLHHVECIEDYLAYIQYMAHIDFTSITNKCKSIYPASEFIGTPALICQCLDKTNILSNWELLGEMYDYLIENGFPALCAKMREENPLDAQRYMDMFRQFQGVMLTASHKFEYNRSLVGGN